MVPATSDIASRQSPYSDRCCPPEETLRRIAPLLLQHGITRLARVTGLDSLGIPVWNAISPNARSIVVNQGKGITDADAKVSAAMEALERAIAGAPDVPKALGSWNSLIDAGALADRLESLIALGQPDIAADEPIAWVAGVDLMSGATILVPYEATILDRTTGGRFWQSSDGLASGNTFDEAALHGLLERIERDAYVLWQVTGTSRRHRSCVDVDAFDDPVIAGLQRRIGDAGLRLVMFDITSDIGIPCYSALLGPADIATRRQPLYRDVSHGSGAHPEPVRAAIRAMTEAAQSRLTFISGGRDDIDPRRFGEPLPVETLECFRIDQARPPVPYASVSAGPAALLAHALDRLRHSGIAKAVAVRLSSAELPIAVAKVFVPDLENPGGARKRKFGARAISRVLGGA